MTENLDKVLTFEEPAAYLKSSKSTLYKLARKGEEPGQKVPETLAFPARYH